MTIRVVIVDDQALMRAAFRMILNAADMEIVGEAGDGGEALAVVARERPDVVLMDVRMPGRDGLAATAELVVIWPEVRVLVLTTFDLDEYLYGALRAGAVGFLLKNATPEDVVRAVRSVADGDAVLDPAVTGRVLARFAGHAGPIPSRTAVNLLTEREKDVFSLLVQGLSNAEIARQLGMGEATAKTHVSRLLAKLGVRDRVQAVIYAYETGFAPAARPSPG